jgi:hypothetical protein
VSAIFLTITAHFGLSPTDAGVHPTRRAMAVSTRVNMLLYGVFVFQTQRFSQVLPETLESCGGHIRHGTSCHYYSYNNYTQEPHKAHARSQTTDFIHTGCTEKEKALNSLRIAYTG